MKKNLFNIKTNLTSRIQGISGELFWICLGQFAVVLGGIFGVRLLTYKLTPSSYGELALGMTVATVAQQIIFGPLGQSFLRFFAPAHENGQLNVYIKTAKILLIKSTAVIVFIAIALIAGLFLTGSIKWIWLFFFAFLFCLFSNYNSILDGVQNAARQRKIVALHQGVGLWLRFLIAVGLINLLGAYSYIAMLGYFIASMLIFISQLIFFEKKIAKLTLASEKISDDISIKYTKKMNDYAWPFSVWGLFTWAQLISDRWALQAFTTARDVGLYTVVYQFGYYPIMMASGLMTQLIVPVLFNRAGSGDDADRTANTLRLNNFIICAVFMIMVMLILLIGIFHKQIFSLVVAPQYRSVSSLLPLLVLSGGLFCIGQIAALRFMIKNQTQRLIYPKVVTAIIGVLLNYIGAYFYGLIGVIVAGIIFSLIYTIWIFVMHYDN